MDPIDTSFRLAASLLPEELSSFVHNHILNPHGPFQAYKREAHAQLDRLLAALYPVVQPALERVLAVVSDNQGAVGVAATLALAAAVIVVLNWVRRLMLWWTRMVFRLVFWSLVVAMAAVVVQRGPMQTAKEVVVVGSKIVGWVAAVQQAMQHQQQYQQQHGGQYSQGQYSQGDSRQYKVGGPGSSPGGY